jgi:hypothetical protein
LIGPENIWLVTADGAAVFLASVLYMIGGTKMSFGGQKWLRRFLASGILAMAANVTALILGRWAWPLVLIWPALIGGFSLGYGGETTGTKVIKRAIFAAGCCSAGVFGLWATGWTGAGIGVLVLQFLIGGGSVYLGVRNPYSNAPLEQLIICLLLTFSVPFWGFVG